MTSTGQRFQVSFTVSLGQIRKILLAKETVIVNRGRFFLWGIKKQSIVIFVMQLFCKLRSIVRIPKIIHLHVHRRILCSRCFFREYVIYFTKNNCAKQTTYCNTIFRYLCNYLDFVEKIFDIRQSLCTH